LIAHRGLIGSDRYGPNEIDILIQWANQQAPDRFEMHRNEAIFEVQGNRNPLIDFPEWVDLIDFSRGLS
jgi:endonuclease I